ncbi:GDSL esterase/lipase WDL1-like isoform X2 [Alnus glutinosa]|uniref:GDSL esterase/lipase WDL1-like isoform X2 n=1 Tax=Alnus glutinosa TaxID=3517 RepID=UPI002D78CCD2|nr:GDSL esterase/lipase WDL1-like isoform X2 [Alnus glutinosa]
MTIEVYKFHFEESRESSELDREREMVGPARPLFVLFGSSIVQLSFSDEGWGAILADLYARKDAAIQPSLVIVYFGGNDSIHPQPSGLGPHVPLPEYIENMKKIALHLKSLSEKTRIIFLSAPPVNEEQICETLSITLGELRRTNESCRIYSEACLELCREMDIKAIDLWTAIQKRDDWLTTSFTDGIHFTSEGSKIVVKEIMKVLTEADWEPSLHWKSLPAEFAEDSPYDPVSLDGKTTVNVSEISYHRKTENS